MPHHAGIAFSVDFGSVVPDDSARPAPLADYLELTSPANFLHARLESELTEGQTIKGARLSEEQIVKVLKATDAGAKTAYQAQRNEL